MYAALCTVLRHTLHSLHVAMPCHTLLPHNAALRACRWASRRASGWKGMLYGCGTDSHGRNVACTTRPFGKRTRIKPHEYLPPSILLLRSTGQTRPVKDG